jgi:uncharacterized membrane protein YesL
VDGRGRRTWLDRLIDVAGLLGNVFVASLAWTALAVLVLPLPAASAALFHTTGLVVADRAGNPFADFLTGLREHWRRATAIGGPVMLLGLVLGVDALYFLGQPTVSLKAVGWLFASAFLIWAAVALMFWPLLVARGGDWRRLLRESFWLTMATLPWRLATIAVAAVAAVAALLYPFLIPLAPGVVAFVASWLARRTLRCFDLVGEAAA